MHGVLPSANGTPRLRAEMQATLLSGLFVPLLHGPGLHAGVIQSADCITEGGEAGLQRKGALQVGCQPWGYSGSTNTCPLKANLASHTGRIKHTTNAPHPPVQPRKISFKFVFAVMVRPFAWPFAKSWGQFPLMKSATGHT
jgi:hypothetical protein